MKKVFCKICKEKKNIEINKNDFFLRTDSSNKNLINYKNLICLNCGTIYHSPEINKKKLIKHYQTNYRKTDSLIDLKNKSIDLPLRFDWTAVSFHRFHAFYEIVNKKKIIKKNKKFKILDYGCYQGAFLYACKKIFNSTNIGTDYNKEGLRMAKSIFGADEIFETNDNFFKKKINADLITLLHVFEHLTDPVGFLLKIKKNVLKKNGLLYLELPNPYTNPLNDPTHLFLYSLDTIKYILQSCNYELITIEERGLYKRGALLRNNRNLNLHILARSLEQKKPHFTKIMIGKRIFFDLLKERKIVGLKLVLERVKTLFISFIHTLYSFVFFNINFLSSNSAVKFHEKVKKIFKNV
jgi:2-polyprenyl-3-methyl-5-hydroxy-6-metoxy-1,4-benzoquinol methylase|tara:strand:+ start:479 stop:1537 length:1059 start_codon:yes stop_codon:yes gene_type:complete